MPYLTVKALFTAICNSVRTKRGTALPIAHQDIPANIDAIVTGGGGADVSGVTAVAGDVLSPKIFVNSLGVEVTGAITSKGAATYTPSGSAQEIAAGQYLSGKQTIAAVPTEEKSATPTTSAQDITPTSGKFLSKVAVGAIPSAYKDMTTADIVAANVLNGKKGGNSTGVITGSMPNNAGDVAAASYHSTGTSIHIVPALGYTDGTDDATVITEAGFIAGNIKSGVSIFGKAGSLSSGTDISDATAVQGEILATKTAYIATGKTTGSMTNVGAQTGAITTKAGTVTPTAGYHNGSGSISIHADEQDKIISGNIKSGVTILGVAGATNVVDTTNAVNSATDATLLSEKKAFVNGESRTGTMPNIGQQKVDISAKATSVIPTKGYHNGAGAIKIATAEQNKIIAGNIKSGITILGVAGSLEAGGSWLNATGETVTDASGNINITGLSFTPLLFVSYMLTGESELIFTVEKASSTWYTTTPSVYRSDITSGITSSYGEIHIDLGELPAETDVTYSVSGIG